MSSGGGEGSCARIRGWQWDYNKKKQRTHQSHSSSSSEEEDDMNFNFDDSDDKSDNTSNGGGYASEKESESLPTDLGALKVTSSIQPMETNPKDPLDEENAQDPKTEDGLNDEARAKDAHQPDKKDRSGKHKDGHKRKDKDHEKRSKRKEKGKDKHSSKDSKKRKEDGDDKRSHERQSRSEKSQREEDTISHRKDKHRAAADRERSRFDNVDDFMDHEGHRHERRWDSGRSSYHKSANKLDREKIDREKDSKRARLESDHRGSNRARSRSPGSERRARSPSPDNIEESREKTEKDGSGRYKRSGLGGYSPRRRRSEAAIRTPSPPARSPERKKTRAWDLPPAGMDSGVAAAMAAAHQAAAQQAAALASVSSLVTVNPALAAVSLTQATRNLRRLYIGNVPVSVSDGELLEFINAAMLSVNANHLPGTKPCINCMVNVEKSYAFAEFLTPEDATAGLAFDGITLHGITLKIRRPRDYVAPPNGGVGLSFLPGMVSSVIPDSPQKIFVGGICKTMNAEKVKEIVTAFGQLKAYHWEVTYKNHQVEAFAFLEYLDPSVTLKACAGLNGMRLGNKILMVVQGTPNASSEPDMNQVPFYGIPEHAKPLLEAPTRILEFQNVITKAEALSMSEVEYLEVEEDVRTECKRFGTIKSMHIVKPEGVDAEKLLTQIEEVCMTEADKKIAEYIASVGSHLLQASEGPMEGPKDPNQLAPTEVSVPIDQPASDLPMAVATKESVEGPILEAMEMSGKPAVSDTIKTDLMDAMTTEANVDVTTEAPAMSMQPSTESDEKITKDEEQETITQSTDLDKVVTENGGPEGMSLTADKAAAGCDVAGNLSSQTDEADFGKIYVEFTREECACKAAHALHGRLFAGRPVITSYFPLKLYQKRFKKGLEARTHEERQALALAAQEHLNSFIPDRD